MQIGHTSFWYQSTGGAPQPGPALHDDIKVDVCIIGAGYTGLWTAYYLMQANPTLRVAIVEKHFAGFGASGRNGGWLTGNFAWAHDKYLSTGTADQIRDMVQVFHGAVDEVIAIADQHGIQADIRRTDELSIATNTAQYARLDPGLAHLKHWGDKKSYLESTTALAKRITIPGVQGGMVTPGVARIQPAKLVRGLADVVRSLGVQIYEQTPAMGMKPGLVTTPNGKVTCDTVIRATEGFTATLPGQKRTWLPLNSAQIVTEPLPASLWAEIGWNGYELLGDMANAYCYCQRTDDGRIAVGGRGIPYKFGSKIDANGTPEPGTIRELTEILHRLFPMTKTIPLAHVWQGVLGVPRDWCATVGLDAGTRIGWAGGYVGVGVSSSNVAGRTLRDLVLGYDTPLTALPWVNRRVRSWEPEPIRWASVRGMYGLLKAADKWEAKSGARWSPLSTIGNWIKGG